MTTNRRVYVPGLTYNRVQRQIRKYQPLHGDRQKHRRREYKREVDVFSTRLGMTRTQRSQTKYLLDRLDIGRLHPHRDMRCKVLALCYLFMYRDNPGRDDIGFDTSVSDEFRLDERAYRIILRNLDNQLKELGVDLDVKG